MAEMCIRDRIQVLPAKNRKLPGLVVADPVAKHREAKLQGAVKHVGLSEAEQQTAGQVAHADLHLKSLTAAEKIIGAVVQADKGAFQAADPAVQADAVLALFCLLYTSRCV